jgi:hypothetical protein
MKISGLRSILAAFVVLLSCTLGTGRASGTQEQIVLFFVDCPNVAQSGSLGITVLSLGVGNAAKPFLDETRPITGGVAIQKIIVSLPAGAYFVSVGRRGCVAETFPVAVLPGHPRNLVAIGHSDLRVFTDNNFAMVSGTLPSTGWRVALYYPDRQGSPGASTWAGRFGYLQVPAVVEGDAYYITGVLVGKAVVRLYDEKGDGWYDFDAGQIDYSKNRQIVRNVTIDDLQRAVGRAETLLYMFPAQNALGALTIDPDSSVATYEVWLAGAGSPTLQHFQYQIHGLVARRMTPEIGQIYQGSLACGSFVVNHPTDRELSIQYGNESVVAAFSYHPKDELHASLERLLDSGATKAVGSSVSQDRTGLIVPSCK